MSRKITMETKDYWIGTDPELEGRWAVVIMNLDKDQSRFDPLEIKCGNNDLMALYEQSSCFQEWVSDTYTDARILELLDIRERKVALQEREKGGGL